MPKILYSRQAMLDYVVKYKTVYDGISPTIREIMSGCGIGSTTMLCGRLLAI